MIIKTKLMKAYNGSSLELKRRVDKSYKTFVLTQPCCVGGSTEVIAHHVKVAGYNGIGIKGPWILAIPLHHHYHGGDQGIHIIGVKTWQKKYGDPIKFLERLHDKFWNEVLKNEPKGKV